MKYYSFFILVLIPVFISSCGPCNGGYKKEPKLPVGFFKKEQNFGYYEHDTTFKMVSVGGYTKEISKPWRYNYYLPVDLSANKTTYVFLSETASDTLTISYNKSYQADCDFVVRLDSLCVTRPTTFDSVAINHNEISVYF